VPLVEPAQELAHLAAVTNQEQQAPVVAIGVEDLDRATLDTDRLKLEELALAIRAHVDARRARAGRAHQLQPGPDGGEPPLESCGFHCLYLSSCR
jgi:hypothetical protein